jgi:hypothetical protein
MSTGKILNTDKFSGVLNNTNRTIIHVGEVVDIEDPSNEGRIKVRVPFYDNANETSLSKKEQTKLNKKTEPYFKVSGSDNKTVITNSNTLQKLDESKQKTDLSGGVDPNAGTEIVWAIPLLPKHLQIMPKVGEKVKLMFFDMGSPQLNRVWVGPLVSQKDKLSYQENVTAGNILNTSILNKLLKNVSGNNKNLRTGDKKIGKFRGGFPDKEDIALMGRNNADIILPTRSTKNDKLNRGGEVLIRAGKFDFNNVGKLSLNTTNPGYLRIKVIESQNSFNAIDTRPKTMSMLFSDYISLVSYNNNVVGKPYRTEVNPIIGNDADMLQTHNSLSPLIRGDVLVEFLELLRDYVKNHNHPYHKLPSTNANSKDKIEQFDLERLLSQGIRIN